MTARIRSYSSLADRILATSPAIPVRLVAVDGGGGAGKTTFAARLQAALGGVPVVHTDDFASHAEPIDWWWRLEEQVLAPLSAGHPGRYQRYDWVARRRSEWHDVPLAPAVIIEGVSSARSVALPRLVLSVWIATPRAVRLARGIKRDGEELRDFWTTWMAAEDAHYAANPTGDVADVVVDGAPTLPHDPEREFVARRW